MSAFTGDVQRRYAVFVPSQRIKPQHVHHVGHQLGVAGQGGMVQHIAAVPVAFQRNHVALLAQRAQHVQPSQPCGFAGESALFVRGEIG